MQTYISPLLIIRCARKYIGTLNLELNFNTIVLIHNQQGIPDYQLIHPGEIRGLPALIDSCKASDIVFLASADKYDPTRIIKSLNRLYNRGEQASCAILVPYKPTATPNDIDDEARSFAITSQYFRITDFVNYIDDPVRLTYEVVSGFQNTGNSHIQIERVGQPDG